MTGLLHFNLIICDKLDARGPASTHDDKGWFKHLLEIKGLSSLHLTTFEVSQTLWRPSDS